MNRSASGSLPTNGELPVLNSTCERRWDISMQRTHLDRLRESTPMVDCRGGAPQFPHLKHRLKRREMERLRSQEIDTENMILLHKMRSIFRDGTVATNSGLPKPVEVLPRSLNQEARRRELERISRENLEIVQRIRASKPCYSATKQLSDQQEREAILKRISRHGRRRLDVFSPSSSTASLLSSGTLGSSSRSITALGRSRSMATQLMSYYEPQAGGPQYGDELGEPSAASSMLNVDELRPTPMRLKPLPGGGKGKMALGKMAPASADSMPPPPPPPPMHVGDKPRTPLYA
ncbi:gamma carbonic dehydratase, partial [Chrysochromulina tobinii]